jgi:hypothetical protein
MNVTKETITPKKAMEWLKRNVHNRPLSMKLSAEYASSMRAKRWMVNGEAIKFNGNGDMIDGQHRLHACIEAGVPFDSYIVRGLEHEAFDTLDQGRRRTCGDILARRGEKHYKMLAASILLACSIERRYSPSKGIKVRPDEVTEYLAANPSIRDCCDYASVHRQDNLMPMSIVVALLFLFRKVDAAKADAFWSRILTGENLTKGMVEYRLRARLIDNKDSIAKLNRQTVAALVIKSFNSAVSGRDLKCIKWADDEAFPLIEGLTYAK